MLLRKIRILLRESYRVLLPIALIIFLHSPGYAFLNTTEEGVCTQDSQKAGGCEDTLTLPPDNGILNLSGEEKAPESQPVPTDKKVQNNSGRNRDLSSRATSRNQQSAASQPEPKDTQKACPSDSIQIL